MRRQVVIGGLVGIALGALITFSFAHGVVSWQAHGAVAPTEPGHDDGEPSEVDEGDGGHAPHRPVRPGSDRIGTEALQASYELAATLPATEAPAV